MDPYIRGRYLYIIETDKGSRIISWEFYDDIREGDRIDEETFKHTKKNAIGD